MFMGREYWQPLMDFLRNRLLVEKTIDPIDVDRILVTDSAEEAVASVMEIALSRFGLTYGPKMKRRRWLWE
jgi:predicted Rossmann-fold nucleotide-binding protein